MSWIHAISTETLGPVLLKHRKAIYYWNFKDYNFKAALTNMFIYTMDQMTACYVNRVTSNECVVTKYFPIRVGGVLNRATIRVEIWLKEAIACTLSGLYLISGDLVEYLCFFASFLLVLKNSLFSLASGSCVLADFLWLQRLRKQRVVAGFHFFCRSSLEMSTSLIRLYMLVLKSDLWHVSGQCEQPT